MVRWLCLLITLLVVGGCSKIDEILNPPKEPPIELTLYMNTEIDDDGNYILNMGMYNYNSVKYTTSQPYVRVFWGSVDSFYVSYQNQIIGSPIINYSTYSNGEGEGTQMMFISSDLIRNEPYTIIGCVSDDNCEWLSFILQ